MNTEDKKLLLARSKHLQQKWAKNGIRYLLNENDQLARQNKRLSLFMRSLTIKEHQDSLIITADSEISMSAVGPNIFKLRINKS